MIPQKCIWMECGYVEYKLCDRNFDCENCPFDKSIKAQMEEKDIKDEKRIKQNVHKIKITPNHIWLIQDGNIFTIGLDDFVQKFFDAGCSISFPMIGSKLFNGKTFLWIIGSFGAIGFHSPVSGSVIWINKKIKDNPHLLFEEDAFSTELIKIESNDEYIEGEVYDYEDYKNLVHRDSLLVREFLLKKFEMTSVGSPTLPDGGEFKTDFLKSLSNQELVQLLKLLFNKKI
jgi:glycine cleavage system H protein